MPIPAPPPPAPSLLLSVEEAAAELRIGRSRMYELVRCGEVLSVKVGGSRRVIRDSLSAYVKKLIAEQANGTPEADALADAGGTPAKSVRHRSTPPPGEGRRGSARADDDSVPAA